MYLFLPADGKGLLKSMVYHSNYVVALTKFPSYIQNMGFNLARAIEDVVIFLFSSNENGRFLVFIQC